VSQRTEIDTFRAVWNSEAQNTIRLLESLPNDQYNFRPDTKGRSIGEMAWHLSEIDACLSYGVAEHRFSYTDEVPHLEKRPKETKLLAPGYRRVHEASVKALDGVDNAQLADAITFSDGRRMTIRDVLWTELLHHAIHHRGQLAMLCRMAGGSPPGIYGPNREEMQAMIARMPSGAT
jgi:uncharacterized damage-inducible protein DinB